MRSKQTPRLASAIAAGLIGIVPLAQGVALAQPVARPRAVPMAGEAAITRSIVVPKDKSVAFRLDRPAGEIIVAQPEMLTLVATTDQSFYVRGKAPGVTNILVYDRARRLTEVIDVTVGYDIEAIQADLETALPGQPVRAQNLAGGVLLTGDVANNAGRARAMAVAERYAPKAVTTDLNVRAAEQVMLEVRIVEASRSTVREFGIDTLIRNESGFSLETGSGPTRRRGLVEILTNAGSASIDLRLQALEEKGVLRTLARPNLVALSGQDATFLAGGEFPFPVAGEDGLVTVQFREFGVNLAFRPDVQDGGLIRLKVQPEVSQLDTSAGVNVNGVVVPGLSTRRVSTTVELRDGETFALAGLFQQEYQNNIAQLPWISDIPVLGALFRSTRWRRRETELVVIVTPRMIAPDTSLAVSPAPHQGGVEPGFSESVVLGRVLDKPLSRPVGAAGK